MIEPTVILGFSDAYGSWKMICISFRSARSERLSSAVTLRPWKLTSPDVGSISRRIERPVVDLPQPDSPTRPSVSPAMMSNDTSSTAWTRATSRENSPPRIGKYFLRFLTFSKASGMAGPSVEEAGHLVARPDFFEWWRVFKMHRLGERAARREPAPGLDVAAQSRHGARNRLELLLLRGREVDPRDRAQEALRVGVQRLLEQLGHGRFLDDLRAVHDDDALGGLG